MLINNYEVTKSISIRNKEFRVFVSAIGEKYEYIFTGKDIFNGDYWDSIMIGDEIFDINFFKYPNYKLSLYRVRNNVAEFEKIYSI